MDEFRPKEMPARKARVFHDARERIVDTGKKLNRERASHDRTARERDLFKSVINDPQKKAFVESLYRQVGAMLADEAMKRIRESVGSSLTEETLIYAQRFAEDAGNYLAADIVRAVSESHAVEMRAVERPENGDVEVQSTVIDIKPMRLRYNRVFLRDW